jgi:malonate transporter and related proteins
MLATFGALAPVFILIALGWVLRTRGFPGDDFWPAAERLVYFVLFPALLFLTTAAADLDALALLPLAGALIAAIGATVALTMALRPWLKVGDAAFTSVLQGGIRCNTYVGLAAGSALFGELGLTIMGLVVFVVVTTVNVVSVVALTHYGPRAAGPRDVVASVVRNPLIVACVLGFCGNALGIELPAVAYETLDVLARASLTLGLLCVGAGLELAHLGRARRAALVTSALKLLVLPAATALACRLFGIDPLSAAAAVLFTAAPISASSYVLARQLGGDATMIAGLITITTIAAVATMPLVLAVLT